ncbi:MULTISPECIES: zf-TFIIB domain-containing protein [Halomonadaceae]|uniref:Transcription factor zinc-finger domain-containing protein n=1 Tax=Vreelandella titanicae TaxID=664683 RepID=A0AAP9T149_9GAMM|nr:MULTISPECIES: zf-TFIIB domain-containing protein [Halomonas]QKS25489.1 hypothetical protein FX987_03285 [Halomonas titanicae]CDG53312.1 hypothetical protein HALA3H3_490096 [Halomonas sp. A3H3]SDJ08844.1 Transcription factor zinc-finger [Halomonas titanicae]
MKCTACQQGNLVPSFIDALFRSHTCDNCGGNWILIEDYISWKERHPEHVFDDTGVESVEAEDTGRRTDLPSDRRHYEQVSNRQR